VHGRATDRSTLGKTALDVDHVQDAGVAERVTAPREIERTTCGLHRRLLRVKLVLIVG